MVTSKWVKVLGIAILVLGLSGLVAAPVTSAPEPKADVCHFQAENEFDAGTDGVLGTEDDVLVSPLGWRVIRISGNALSAHIDVHTDGTTSDFVIATAEDLAACQSLTPFITEG